MAAQRRQRPAREENRVAELLHTLCSLHCRETSHIPTLYSHALTILESGIAASSSGIEDEFKISERIQKKLVREKREKDAVTFLELNQRLSAQGTLRRCGHTLLFLLTVSEDSTLFSGSSLSSILLSQTGRLSYDHMGVIPNPSSFLPSSSLPPSSSATRTGRRDPVSSESHTLVGSSGIGSLGTSHMTSVPSHMTSQMGHMTSNSTITQRDPGISQSSLATPFPCFHSTPQTMGVADLTRRHGGRDAWAGSSSGAPNERVLPNGYRSTKSSDHTSQTEVVSDSALLRDVLFVFQNIDGRYIHFDSKLDAFRISSKFQVCPSVRDIVHRLCEVGWLFRKVRTFVDSRAHDKSLGLVCQSFCSALSEELTEFYKLIAVLEAQQTAVVPPAGSGRGQLTLRRLLVWTHDPLERLKYLAVLVGACKGQKGGALVSTLHSYSHHGDPYICSLLTGILTKVYQPLNAILNSWIFDGELVDHFSEFIVSCDLSSKPEKLWRSKYKLRKAMVPCFVSEDLAKKILIIGKSINFLRQVCHDHTPLWSPSLRLWFTTESGEVTFSSMTGSSLQSVVAQTYTETSRHLLQIMNTKYSFGKHLQAIRKYLLLGQGDLIRHLMDLLAPELSKPAVSLYLHNLTGTLETAIRATNAQFEDPDILKRLDVQKLEPSPQDQGWDVFSLQYHVDGPISTVFTAENMLTYLKVFNFLWRAKRVQYYLSHIWNEQTANYRPLQSIPELHPVVHQCHLLISAMVHFISQLQYYINFEVMECNWDSLLKKVREAEDLDQIISAHDTFLLQITSQSLLNTDGQVNRHRILL
jgi:gamma-tubulin complex component 3